MNQSAVIGGALLAGFALFIASRDRLPTYARVLWGAKPDAHGATGSEGGDTKGGGIAPELGDSLDILGNWGYGVGDILRDGLPHVPSIPDMGAYGF